MKLVRWISASAGSGKTTKIAELVDALLRSGVPAHSILCLSFANRSAIELENRFNSQEQNRLNDGRVQFSTIHGFANSIVRAKHIIAESIVDEKLREAIELVLLEEKWYNFFQSSYENWGTLLSDLKFKLYNDNHHNVDLSTTIAKVQTQFNPKITLSKELSLALEGANLHEALRILTSNDFNLYMTHLVTKDFQINKRFIPESFTGKSENYELCKELDTILRKIQNEVITYSNNEHLRHSTIGNLFLNSILSAYTQIKEAQHLTDFSDLIRLAKDKISKDPSQIAGIRHIFLDEAQDTNPMQWQLVYTLASDVLQLDNTSITIVGDSKQIIYEFNGASHALYDQMKSQFRNCIKELNGKWEELKLNYVHRSPKLILDFVDNIMHLSKYPTQHITHNPNHGLIKTWLPLVTDKEKLSAETGWIIPGEQHISESIQLCISEIKRLLSSAQLLNTNRKVIPSDILLLIPRRCINTFILIEELKRHKIPINQSPFSLSTDQTIQEFIAIAEICLDRSNDLLIAGILKGPYFQWTNAQLEDLAINREDSLWNAIETRSEEHIRRVRDTLSAWFDVPQDTFTFYATILFHTDYGLQMQKLCPNEVATFWTHLLNTYTNALTLAEFIYYMKIKDTPIHFGSDGISISTVHGAKGTEANIVIIFNSHTNAKTSVHHLIHEDLLLMRGNYLLYKNAKTKYTLDQDKQSDRLLYVALTRAKEQLYIIPPLTTDSIHPKSWYGKIMKNLHLFKLKADGSYELVSNGGDSTVITSESLSKRKFI